MAAATSRATNRAKHAAALAAIQLIKPFSSVALGTGSTVEACLPALANVPGLTATPTSEAIAQRAREAGIELVPVTDHYDVYIDGADQVSPEGHVIKGSWGAHVRERCLGALAQRRILICDHSKLRPALVGPVPVAVVPYFAPLYQREEDLRLDENGLALVQMDAGRIIEDPRRWEADMSRRPGVVVTGLFPADFLDEIIVGYDDGHVETIACRRAGEH